MAIADNKENSKSEFWRNEIDPNQENWCYSVIQECFTRIRWSTIFFSATIPESQFNGQVFQLAQEQKLDGVQAISIIARWLD